MAKMVDPLLSLRDKGYDVLTEFRLRCTEQGCYHHLNITPEAVGHYGVRYTEPHTGHVMEAEQRIIVASEWVEATVDAVAAVIRSRHPSEPPAEASA